MQDVEVFINNTKAVVDDSFSMAFTYQIADIVQPDKRNTSFSKTLKMPGCKVNNILFGHIFDMSKEILTSDPTINFSPDFNPNLKADCSVYIKSTLVFSGIIQLLQVTIVDKKIEYEVSLYGSLRDIFTEFDKLNISDLNFSEYDHLFTKANQKLSWDTSIIKNGVAYQNFNYLSGTVLSGIGKVMQVFGSFTISYANIGDIFVLQRSNGSRASFPLSGISLLGPGPTYSSALLSFSTATLTTGEHVKVGPEETFGPKGEGYVYPIIHYGLDQGDIDFYAGHLYPAIYLKTYIDKMFERAGFTYTSDFFNSLFFKSLIIPFCSDSVLITPDEILRRSFIVTQSADLVIVGADPFLYETLSSPIILKFNDETTPPNYDGNNLYDQTTRKYTCVKAGQYDFSVTLDASLTVANCDLGTIYCDIVKNGASLASVSESCGGSITVASISGKITVSNVKLNKGDKVYVVVRARAVVRDTGAGFITHTLKVNAGATFSNNPLSLPILEGDLLQMNATVPKDVLMKDFFKSIIQAFNLYVDVDKRDKNNLIIEPLINFYEGNSVVDWSAKLDVKKEIWIKPVAEIQGKDYVFTYKEDSDHYNQKYKDRYRAIYGDRDIRVFNDFVQGKNLIELVFAPTPMVGTGTANDMVYPALLKQDDTTGEKTPLSTKIRLLYYGGVKDAGGSWNYHSVSGTTIETKYPYCGHLDDAYLPTVDLNFNVPNEIYWGGGSTIGSSYTNNNLFNKYYRQFIDEITDKDSKLVTAYFRLRPIDIFNLNFRNFIHVAGINYRLNKIKDYDPLSDESVQVELSKIRAGIPFTAITIDLDNVANDPRLFSIIDGGKDEIRSMSATSPWLILDGGVDTVRSSGATSITKTVNGGKN